MGVFQNNLMGAAAAAASAGGDFYDYQIANSVRMSYDNNTTLKFTAGTPTSRKTFTYSWWWKRYNVTSTTTQRSSVFTAGTGGGTYVFFPFTNGSTMQANFNFTGGNFGDSRLTTNMLFRDTSAWYHCVLRFDSTQATASNRVRLYVNGEEPTYSSASVQTDIAQDEDISFMNQSGVVQSWGGISGVATGQEGVDVQLADVILCDGQSYGPDSFGETKNGVWIPKDPSGLTFGNNGYYLKFESSSDLGNDSSGNNNDFTANNLATHDQMLDSPTFNSSSNGGNFITYNPLNKGSYTVLSEGNLKADSNTGADATYPSGTFGVNSGKWYVEHLIVTLNGNFPQTTLVDFGGSSYNTNQGIFYAMRYHPANGCEKNSGDNIADFGTITIVNTGVATFTTGDIVSWYIDMDNKKAWIAKNGTIPNSGDPANGTNPQFSWTENPINSVTVGSVQYQTSDTILNAGQDGTFAGNKTAQGNSDDTGYGNFYYAPPTGFLALCSGNLPTADAVDPAQTDDNYSQKLFGAKTYTGDGGTNAITGLGFQPDWVWIKERGGANNHMLFDSNRGTSKYMSSNTSGDEGTDSATMNTFGSDGFTVGSDGKVNASSDTYVAWNWRANGGTTSTNSTGSVSVTQQVDPSGGFSISTYSGAGGTGTIGHGLNSAPTFVVVKQRNGANSWAVYAKGAGATKYSYLNGTNAFGTAAMWQNTTPSSSLVYLGDNNEVNHSGRTYVAYCFADTEGYIKSGLYVGNGSTDNAFVYTGFRPAFVMIKGIAAGAGWNLHDNACSPFNVASTALQANTASAELSNYNIDMLSNGFKVRDADGDLGTNGNTYVYLAFAKNPFKYATAR